MAFRKPCRFTQEIFFPPRILAGEAGLSRGFRGRGFKEGEYSQRGGPYGGVDDDTPYFGGGISGQAATRFFSCSF